jgi:hypothetical protein
MNTQPNIKIEDKTIITISQIGKPPFELVVRAGVGGKEGGVGAPGGVPPAGGDAGGELGGGELGGGDDGGDDGGGEAGGELPPEGGGACDNTTAANDKRSRMVNFIWIRNEMKRLCHRLDPKTFAIIQGHLNQLFKIKRMLTAKPK